MRKALSTCLGMQTYYRAKLDAAKATLAKNSTTAPAAYIVTLESKVATATQALNAAKTAAADDTELGIALKDACFSSGTLVWTENGPCEIQYLGKGISVLSRNESTGEMSFRPVIEFFVHSDKPVYDVCYSDEGGNTGGMLATAEHPFWVIGQGWTAVRDLKPGHVIQTCNGSRYLKDYNGSDYRLSRKINQIYENSTVTIDEVLDRNISDLDVFNLNVEENHTYFVGLEGLWVHNCNNDTAKNPRPTVSILEALPKDANATKSTKLPTFFFSCLSCFSWTICFC